MKSITATTIIAFCLLVMNVSPAMGCDCETKANLDIRDWNDAGIILQGLIVNTSVKDGIGEIEFETEMVYRGDHPGDYIGVTYLVEDEHTLAHALEEIGKDQHWILFLEKGSQGIQLQNTRLPGYCALSRKVAASEDDTVLSFLEEMKEQKNGPTKLYHTNGNLRADGTYNWGTPMGKWNYYDEQGKITESGSYLVGRRNGMWDTYTINEETGTRSVSARSQYALGRVYTHEEYHSNGKLKVKHKFLEDEKESSYYNTKGEMESMVMATPSGASSVTAYYYPGGNIREITVIKDSNPIKQTFYNEHGEIIAPDQANPFSVSSE